MSKLKFETQSWIKGEIHMKIKIGDCSKSEMKHFNFIHVLMPLFIFITLCV